MLTRGNVKYTRFCVVGGDVVDSGQTDDYFSRYQSFLSCNGRPGGFLGNKRGL